MAFGISTGDVAEACARHPWRTLGFWLLVIAVAVFLASGLDGELNNDDDFTNNPDSARADALMSERIPDGPSTETVVIHSDALAIDDPAFRTVVEQTTSDLTSMTNIVA